MPNESQSTEEELIQKYMLAAELIPNPESGDLSYRSPTNLTPPEIHEIISDPTAHALMEQSKSEIKAFLKILEENLEILKIIVEPRGIGGQIALNQGGLIKTATNLITKLDKKRSEGRSFNLSSKKGATKEEIATIYNKLNKQWLDLNSQRGYTLKYLASIEGVTKIPATNCILAANLIQETVERDIATKLKSSEKPALLAHSEETVASAPKTTASGVGAATTTQAPKTTESNARKQPRKGKGKAKATYNPWEVPQAGAAGGDPYQQATQPDPFDAGWAPEGTSPQEELREIDALVAAAKSLQNGDLPQVGPMPTPPPRRKTPSTQTLPEDIRNPFGQPQKPSQGRT